MQKAKAYAKKGMSTPEVTQKESANDKNAQKINEPEVHNTEEHKPLKPKHKYVSQSKNSDIKFHLSE